LAGATAIDTSVAACAVTVKVVDPEILPDVAVIVVVPPATPVARPLDEIVAVAVFDELQATDPVMFCVVLSEYVPVAVNCCVAPIKMLGLAGVTAMEASVAAPPPPPPPPPPHFTSAADIIKHNNRANTILNLLFVFMVSSS
jgi:hypothetical protein